MTNILTNVPEVLKSLVPPPKHELAAKFKDQMLRRCKGQECVKQPVQALNMRASIAEQEATVRRLLGGSSRSQADIDRDIETQMARTHQLKKAIMTKAGLGTNVEPINDGVFQNDILLTTDQADALINAVQNDDPGSVPVQGRAGGRRKRSALFFEEQLVKVGFGFISKQAEKAEKRRFYHLSINSDISSTLIFASVFFNFSSSRQFRI